MFVIRAFATSPPALSTVEATLSTTPGSVAVAMVPTAAAVSPASTAPIALMSMAPTAGAAAPSVRPIANAEMPTTIPTCATGGRLFHAFDWSRTGMNYLCSFRLKNRRRKVRRFGEFPTQHQSPNQRQIRHSLCQSNIIRTECLQEDSTGKGGNRKVISLSGST